MGAGAADFVGPFYRHDSRFVVSQQFIPFLQVGSAANVAPPYLVEIAWQAVGQIYLLFGGLFLVALAVLSWRLLNMKVFESIKMGETV